MVSSARATQGLPAYKLVGSACEAPLRCCFSLAVASTFGRSREAQTNSTSMLKTTCEDTNMLDTTYEHAPHHLPESLMWPPA
eukprot:11617480-Alexandrium_andersonii.AAC.1